MTRWGDADFVRGVLPSLQKLFLAKSPIADVDVRGITVGLDGALSELVDADFQDTRVTALSASFGKFSCSFSRAQIATSQFESCAFDTCRFKSSRFTLSSFERATFDNPTLDDAHFLQCGFSAARITGRRTREYGGRRVLFEKCDFSNTEFRSLQLRACSFRDCVWTGTQFVACLLSGTKFEGSAPPHERFRDCVV